MGQLYKIFLIFLITNFLLYISGFYFNMIEPLADKTNVVLIGDSVFDNDLYADTNVIYLLQKEHPNCLLLAEDDSTIDDIPYQIKKIPGEYNNKNTKVIVSVGGNDLLNQYVYGNNDYQNLNQIFENYKKKIYSIKSQGYEVILGTIYFPPYQSYKPYYNIIKEWNTKIKNFAKNNKFKIFPLDKMLNTKQDFSNEIEPSSQGSHKIVDQILNLN